MPSESQVVALELEAVEDKLPVLFDREDTFFSQISRGAAEVVSSRDMRIPLELRPGGKSGYYDPDGGDMGRGGMPSFDKALISSVHMRHAVEFTTKAMWSTDSKRKAIADTLKRQLATGMKEFRRTIDSYCMTAGDGVLGTIGVVSNAAGVDTYTLNSDGFGARLLRYGMNIRVFDSTLATDRTAAGEREITFHDLANKQIKVAEVAGSVAGDVIVASGLSATPPVGMLGVKYHHSSASTGTWLGFDRATTPEIRGNRVNANSSALTLPLPRLAMNKIGDRLGMNAQIKCDAWMHPAQVQAYEELGMLVSQINKSAKSEALDLYFSDDMKMAGAPVRKHFSWDRKRIDFIAKEQWKRAELTPIGFYKNPDNGQRVWEIRGASGGIATAWIFYLVASFNIYMLNPAAGSYIDSLAVPSGY